MRTGGWQAALTLARSSSMSSLFRVLVRNQQGRGNRVYFQSCFSSGVFFCRQIGSDVCTCMYRIQSFVHALARHLFESHKMPFKHCYVMFS